MKRGFILLMSLLLLVFISFFVVLNLQISSYTPRHIRDLSLYTQAQILAQNGLNLAKYFLIQAKKQNKECLDYAEFNYPRANDLIRIDYFYPLQECKNFQFISTNKDANLSKDNLIIVNISVLLNGKSRVNEEIFVNRKEVLYTNEDF